MQRIAALLLLSVAAQATSYTSVATGNWNSTSTWSPSGIPGSGDTVALANGFTVTIPAGYTATFGTSGVSATIDMACTSASGTGVLVNNGTLIYRGGVQPCAGWSAGAGAHFQHDSSLGGGANYLWQFPVGCTACSLTLNGTSGSHVTWDVASGSGNAGYIGVASIATPGRMTATYTDWANIGTSASAAMQMSLNTSGDTFSLHNSRCDNCSSIRVLKMVDGSVFSLQSFVDPTNIAGASLTSRALAFGESTFLTAKTSGTREILNSYIGGIGAVYMACTATGNIDPGFVIQGLTAYATGASGFFQTSTCSMSGADWSSILAWTNPPSTSGAISNIPGGVLNSTYLLGSNSTGTCTSINYHLTNSPVFTSDLNGFIAESDCPQAAGMNGHIFIEQANTAATALRIHNTIALPATASVGGGAPGGTVGVTLQLYAGTPTACDGVTTFCNVPTIDHNTSYATSGSGSPGLYYSEGTHSQTPVLNGLRDNIIWRATSGPITKLSWTSSGPTTSGSLQGVGCNWRYNDSGTASPNYQTAGGNVEYATPSTPGGAVGSCAGDYNANPNFVDSSRNFLNWCKTINPADTTWAQCFAHFASITASASGYAPSALISWIQAGFQPQNVVTATADSTGGQIGAMPLYAPTPVAFYTDLVNGMCSGGLSNLGHIITIDGSGFGTTQGSSYVTLTSGGVGQNAAAYLLWRDNKISFQPGCTFADGTDTTITVTTAGGTTIASLPFHVYTGGTIYFADQGQVTGVVGSDTNNGLSPATPFLTINKCIAVTKIAAGNACYVMPGFYQGALCTNGASCHLAVDGSSVAMLPMDGWHGTATKNLAIIGYPTADQGKVPLFGCDHLGGDCPTTNATLPVGSTRIIRSYYITLANLHFQNTGNSSAARALQTEISGITNSEGHHYRFVDFQITSNGGAGMAAAIGMNSYVDILGWSCHDLFMTSSKFGCLYVGASSYHINIGWFHADYSCAQRPNGTECHVGRGIEVHPTNNSTALLVPPFSTSNLSGTTGGTLAAGKYDIALTYRSHNFNTTFDPVTGSDTETTKSTTASITIDGTTQTAISVAQPNNCNSGVSGFGCNTYPNLQDGETVLCNPAMAYKVYACLEDPVTHTCTLAYQDESVYANLSTYNGSSAPNFTLASLISGVAPPALNLTSISGCFPVNWQIHDSKFNNNPGWDIGLLNNIAGAIYNNTFSNSGNWTGYDHANDPNQPGRVAIQIYDNDKNGAESPVTTDYGNTLIYNNTFYNCGFPGVGSGCVYGDWQTDMNDGGPRYPGPPVYATRTFTLTNNIIVQKQTSQYFNTSTGGSEGHSNFLIQGSHNLCLGGSTQTNCPSLWNSSGGINSDPVFVSNGASQVDPNGFGGLTYTGFDYTLQPGSPAIGAGVDMGFGTNLGAASPMVYAPSCSITGTFGAATVGSTYAVSLTKTNCASGLTWAAPSLGTGACSGMSINPSTGGISGTPTTAGTCNFTVMYDTTDQPFSFVVGSSPFTTAFPSVFGAGSVVGAGQVGH